MILELISFLTTSAGGVLAKHIGNAFQGKQDDRYNKQENAIVERLADKPKALKAYLDHVRAEQTSPSSVGSPEIKWMLICLCGTYCACTLSLFCDNPSGIVSSKDPAQDGRIFSLFWGFVKYDLSNNQVIHMSRCGLGFLMCYPINFILTMRLTDSRSKRIK